MNILDQIANQVSSEQVQALRGEDIEPDYTDDLLDAYEKAFTAGFWEHLIAFCKAVLPKAAS